MYPTQTRSILFLMLPVILFVVSLYQRIPHVDDAWLGEQAYFLAEEGHVKSNLFSGLLSYEKNLLVYHKLFIWMGALVIKAFGFHLFVLKSISLCALIFFILFFWKTSEELWEFSRSQKIFYITFLLTFYLILELSFVFRPEVLMMAMGYVVFQQINKYLKSEKLFHLFMAALVAGLSMVTHLNGLVFIGSGILLLFIYCKGFKWLQFGLMALPFALLYFANLHSWEDLQLFLTQFTQDPALYKAKYKLSIWNIPVKLLIEHQRFFSHGYSIALSAFCLVSMWLFRKELNLNKTARRTLTYFLGIVLFLALSSHGTTNKYLLLSLPFLLYFPTQALLMNPYPKLLRVLFLAFFIVNFQKSITYILRQESLVDHYSEVFDGIPKDKILLAPITAIFDSLPNHTMISDKVQVLISETYSNKDVGPDSLIEQLKKTKFDYLVVNYGSEGKFLEYLPQVKEALHLKVFKEQGPTIIYSVDP